MHYDHETCIHGKPLIEDSFFAKLRHASWLSRLHVSVHDRQDKS